MTPDMMTPQQIDTQLETLYLQEAQTEQRLAAALISCHRAIGENPRYGRNHATWPTTNADAERLCREKATAPGYQAKPWETDAKAAINALDAARRVLAEIRTEMDPLAAEYARRPWSRFFTVQQSNGHVHSSMTCSTCNRSGKPTAFAWNPGLSGLTEAEAVKALGPHLCTVCFPTAPVEWTAGNPQTDRCDGSGKPPVPGTSKRYGTRIYGQCAVCPEDADPQLITSMAVVRGHKPKK